MAKRPGSRATPHRKPRGSRRAGGGGRATPKIHREAPAEPEAGLAEEEFAEGEFVDERAEEGRPARRARAGPAGLGLGPKFAAHVAALIFLVMIFWGWVISGVTGSRVEEQIILKGIGIADAVAIHGRTLLEAVAAGTPPARTGLEDLGKQHEDLLNVMIQQANTKQAFMMRPTKVQVDPRRETLRDEPGLQVHRVKAKTDRGWRRAIEINVPVNGARGQLGSVRLHIDARRVDEALSSLRVRMFGAGIIFLVIGAGLSFVLGAHVARPAKVLMEGMQRVADGDYDHETPVTSGDEIGRITAQFNYMTWALRELRAKGELVDDVESQLDAAREIQASLLPPKIPQIPGLDMFPFYRSAKEVGGDYYDFFPIDKQRLAFVIADVSGKGIPGSMVMASTRTILRILGPQCGTAAEALRQTNVLVHRDIRRGMFVTAMLALLNVRTREMSVCSAGHNPMALYRERTASCELVNPSGIALGFDKGPVFDRTLQEFSTRLEPGDRAVMYTDGVVEAMNERNDEYGDERLYAFAREHARMRSRDFVQALVRDLDAHKGEAEQHDDITVLTFRALS